MTVKEFWMDPYKTESVAHVTSVDGADIQLDRTIFFAFSGGQESDSGTIAGFEVLKAEKRNKDIVYTLKPEHSLKIGDKVTVKINWERRHRLMRLHFAAELVLELICQKFPDTEKVGAHIAQDKARIDFQWPENISKILPDIQAAAQKIIDSSQPIISDFSDQESERRFWKIEEFSQVPCGGTHLANTKEIGKIKLKRVNPGKGKERVEIFVD
ncbi:alanyl-tRNA editing protein [Bdellovibrio bacteriovorus]|uniref:Alanyl-tRNA editing protein n=1 Tax=Bdellovibrio bacteriovorus TaxID=959 RepID=A0A150WQK4_BDEBC|nr:alanyl-tRNA editing protein [Bdellovibrio bacteriovorus]KYG66579.1 alanyl-tRNA editing protein [Bdellovibrio bacteriovorus]